MKIFFGGVRGTSPVARSDFMRFGGETTSLLIEGAAGERIILDAGTGLRALGPRLGPAAPGSQVLMLMTHYHLDHLMGLPSFSLLYNRLWHVDIAAPLREGVSVEGVVRRVLAKPFWPVQLEKMCAKLRFFNLPDNAPSVPYRYGKLEIRWCAVHHPEGCHAYRVDEPATGASLVFATDMEWGLSTPAEKQAFLRLCRKPQPVSVLVMDGQFAAQHYAKFKGWGHSTWEDDLYVAGESGAGHLLITHHAPENNDIRLEKLEQEIMAITPQARLAREGVEIAVEA